MPRFPTVGWLFPDFPALPSVRICGLNVHAEMVAQGIDSHLVRLEGPPVARAGDSCLDAVRNELRARSIQVAIVHRHYRWTIPSLRDFCDIAGVRLVYYACDPIEELAPLRCVDGIIASSNVLRAHFSRALPGKDVVYIPDAHETPSNAAKTSYRSGRGLRLAHISSRRLETIPFSSDESCYRLDTIGARTALDFVGAFSSRLFRRAFRWKHPGRAVPVPTRYSWDPGTVLEQLLSCDVGIIPADAHPLRWKSNNRLTQLMSVGLPTIAYPTEAYEEIVEHGENAMLARSTEEWDNALEQLRDEQTREYIGRNAWRTTYRQFHVSGIVKAIGAWLNAGLDQRQA